MSLAPASVGADVTAGTFRRAFEDAWAASDRTFDHLAPDALLARPIPLRHPFVFYLGHLPAFAVNQVLRGALRGAGVDPALDELFERGIDPADERAAAAVSRASWPARADVEAYRDRARARVLEAIPAVLARGDAEALTSRGRILRLVLEHEWMHQETLLYLIEALEHARKRPPPQWLRTHAPRPVPIGVRGRVEVPAGRVRLGTSFDAVDFAWDNELPETDVEVPAFRIDRAPATYDDLAEFVADGGYERRAWWDDAGWAWRSAHGLRAPWRFVGGTSDRRVRALFGDVPWSVASAWPAAVSHAEASAYARWRGARLPTEAEVRRAAEAAPAGEVVDLLENGWSWTSTPFAPFPGFTPWARTYSGYSADFFDGAHRVMLGASFATHPGLRRASFRNWFQPRYPHVFSQLRTVADDDGARG